MKLISVDQAWFIKNDDATLNPLIKTLNVVLNQDLPSNEYVVAQHDKPGRFTVMSMNKDGGLDGHLDIRIVKLPDPETDPFIIIYNVATASLADKLHAFLIAFHPKAKIVLSPDKILQESTIEKLKSMF